MRVVGALIVWLARRPTRIPDDRCHRWGRRLLTAIWTLPLLATLGYTSDMGYEPIGHGPGGGFLGEFGLYMFPWYPAYVLWMLPLIVAAVVGGILARQRATIELAALTAVMGLAFRFWEGFTDLFHSTPVWNLRLLPFWYLGLLLLAMLGAAEAHPRRGRPVGQGVEPRLAAAAACPGGGCRPRAASPETLTATEHGDVQRSDRDRQRDRSIVLAVTIAILSVVVAAVGIWRVYVTTDFITFWAKWNYSGYEHTGAESDTKVYPEFKSLVSTLDRLPPGRALWEGGSSLGVYGTPLALMLLPYFTDGRIASMEGLYYESSATTPYHFLSVSALSAPGNASNPQRNLPYRTLAEFDVGVKYMQTLGVRYYMAFSDQARELADRSTQLTPVRTTPDTDGQPPVVGRSTRCVTLPSSKRSARNLSSFPACRTGTGRTRSECRGGTLHPHPADARDLSLLDRPLVADGPSSWARARPPGASRADAPKPKLPAAKTVPAETLPPVEVSRVRTTDHSVSFRVSRTGVPVMVKTSYFPNWTASGAKGPWRATPNFMVVVPTSHEVRLDYSTTRAEYLGRVGTVAGVFGVAGLALWPWWRKRRKQQSVAANGPAGDAGYPAAE